MFECPGGLSPGIRHPQAAVPSRPRIVQLVCGATFSERLSRERS